MYCYSLHTGVAIGTELCRVESSPMTDPTLWTFVTTEHTNFQYGSIMITTVCTLLAFILGITCGLIAYRCISVLLKRQQSTSLRHQIEEFQSNKKAHTSSKGTSIDSEANTVYDEVTHHYCKTGIPNVQLELKENVAYARV